MPRIMRTSHNLRLPTTGSTPPKVVAHPNLEGMQALLHYGEARLRLTLRKSPTSPLEQSQMYRRPPFWPTHAFLPTVTAKSPHSSRPKAANVTGAGGGPAPRLVLVAGIFQPHVK